MIKFIYFDVGGVVIKDFSKTDKWDVFMKGLGINSSDYKRFDVFWENLNVSIRDDMEPIVPIINTEFGLNLPSNYDLLSDFVGRFERNESIWPAISKAKSKYKIGLLTNMYPRMFDLIEARRLMPNVKWDVVIDSSIEKVQKPDKAIYDLARYRADVEHSEIMFVENSKSHVEAASKLGWQTFWYDSGDYEKSSEELAKLI